MTDERPQGPARVGALYMSEDTVADCLRTISAGGDNLDMEWFLRELEPFALTRAYGYEVNREVPGEFSFGWQVDDLWVVASGTVAKNGVIYWNATKVKYQEVGCYV